MPYLRTTLFDSQSAAAGKYLRVKEQITYELLAGASFMLNGRACGIEVCPELGIEMFLSSYGVGLLSIALAPTEGALTTMNDARDFNALLHFGAAWRTKERLASLSRGDKDWSDIELEATTADLPAIASFLAPGLVWPGAERTSISHTVKPRAVQRSFAVFAVVQLASDVDFADETCRQQLGPELAGLQNSWASNHPGAAATDIPVMHALLSRSHWMAVGHQGAAHLVSQLEPTVRDVKYRELGSTPDT